MQGFYSCVAQDGRNSISATIYITVISEPCLYGTRYITDPCADLRLNFFFKQGLPEILSKNESAIAVEGAEVSLWCQFDGRGAPTNVTWYDPANQLVTYGPYIQLKDLRVATHWGHWKCRGCNIAGCTSSQILLHVLGKHEAYVCFFLNFYSTLLYSHLQDLLLLKTPQ